jgi:hypothetical protein
MLVYLLYTMIVAMYGAVDDDLFEANGFTSGSADSCGRSCCFFLHCFPILCLTVVVLSIRFCYWCTVGILLLLINQTKKFLFLKLEHSGEYRWSKLEYKNYIPTFENIGMLSLTSVMVIETVPNIFSDVTVDECADTAKVYTSLSSLSRPELATIIFPVRKYHM